METTERDEEDYRETGLVGEDLFHWQATSNRYPKRTSSALLYGTLLYAILLKELANFSRM